MQTTIAVLLASVLSGASASPVARAQMCNMAPTVAANADIKPISQPSCATADLCRQACEAENSCQSFVYGLPPAESAPKCLLFAMPAAQIPIQGDDLHVFDKACTGVPTVAPTHTNPQGTSPTTTTTPSKGQGQSQGQTNPSQGQGQTGQGQGQGQQANHKRDTCGAAPAGPSGNAPAPLRTVTTPASLADCLTLCKATSGCQSCEFGRGTANGPLQCILFSVPVASLPPPAAGASIVASDVGC